MFAGLFKRAEASVDNAIGELGNRILIAIPFIAAAAFLAASLWAYATRVYGPEVGNLVVAGGFFLLGCLIAAIVKMRSRSSDASIEADNVDGLEEHSGPTKSIFEDENMMSIVSAAAPVVLPALLRTATKNWPLVLTAAAGLYVFTRSDAASTQSRTPLV